MKALCFRYLQAAHGSYIQEAINAIVDGSLILESDDEYIELQGKGEIELSCGAASVILKKQIKDDMYTIDVNLKSIGEA